MNQKDKINWEEKVWGRVIHVFSSSSAAISYLEVEKGFQCSRHYHMHRKNFFAVVSGKIIILEWDEDTSDLYDLVFSRPSKKTLLEEGETYSVPANVDHMFCVVESGVVVEYYSPETDEDEVKINDIIRRDTGGEIPEGFIEKFLGE
jgi:mannose-6-phosphate isomerase-like protein (cupin superfamily)